MLSYTAKRLASTVLVVFVVSLITFSLTRVVLGDPVQAILGGQGSSATPEQIERLRSELRLDEPILVQYADWIGGVMTGDLGRSFLRPASVGHEIASRLPVTIELTVLALLLALVGGVVLGVLGALRPGRWLDLITSTTSVLSLSLPNFFLGVVFVYIFALVLNVLPSSGFIPLTENVWGNLRNMILPSLTLSAAYLGAFARYTRALMIRILGDDYVVRAVASGIPTRRVISRHALRNASIPLVTVVGLNVASLVGGAVVTETVFSLPGIGTLLTTSVLGKDLPMIEGLVLFITAGVVLLNLVIDLVYGLIDPRVRVS